MPWGEDGPRFGSDCPNIGREINEIISGIRGGVHVSSAGAIGYFNFKMINWVPRGKESKQCLKYLNTFRFKVSK